MSSWNRQNGNSDVQICHSVQEDQPMKETTLVLIRQAHVDNGKNGPRMCGWLDVPLSAAGELQLQCFRNESSLFKLSASYFSMLKLKS